MTFRSLIVGTFVLAAGALPAGSVLAQDATAPAPATPAEANGASTAPVPLAKDIPTPVVIVIDIQQILQNSTAAKGIRDERDTYLQAYQTEFAADENALRQADQELAKQRTLISQEAFAEKVKAFEKKAADFQNKVQNRRRALEQSYGTAMSQVQQTLVQVTDQLAQELGANLVLNKSQTFLLDPKMDVSAVVTDRLNNTLASVVFPKPLDTVESDDKTQAAPAAPAKPDGKAAKPPAKPAGGK